MSGGGRLAGLLLVVLGASGDSRAAPRPPRRPIEEIVAAVSARNLEASVRKLASFHTRHTLSETESDTRGVARPGAGSRPSSSG